ncbi:MAG TPA: GldG family protein [Polyangiaceae bacterium]|jgi:hypothetical protein|nr:GldG family protein [Polyangiaceae bacterium]
MNAAPFRWARSARVMSALGIFSAVVLMVCVNVLVRRHYLRWDVSGAGLYSLSQVTLETLQRVDEPIEVTVLLGQSDPVTPSVKQILESYTAQCRWLRPRFIDPDRDQAEYGALQAKYNLVDGARDEQHADDGTAILLLKGVNFWRIAADDLVAYNEQQGSVQPKLEQAITSGIRNVVQQTRRTVCFSQGHQEASVDNGAEDGLSAFRTSLERNNFTAQEVEMGPLAQAPDLSHCDLLVIAGPRVGVEASFGARLLQYAKGGGRLLVLMQPTLTPEGTVASSGLEGSLVKLGVEVESRVVFEQTSEFILPVGIPGEMFLATPKPHAITRALANDGQARLRVLMQMPQSLQVATSANATPLLSSSERAAAIAEPGRLSDPNLQRQIIEIADKSEKVLAIASELTGAQWSSAPRVPRVVVVGSLAPFTDASLRGGAFEGSRRFVDGTIDWLVGDWLVGDWLMGAPAMVNVPEKPAHEAVLNLTEASLSEVSRYVLVYMPGAAFLLGALILMMRRAGEQSSRHKGKGLHS